MYSKFWRNNFWVYLNYNEYPLRFLDDIRVLNEVFKPFRWIRLSLKIYRMEKFHSIADLNFFKSLLSHIVLCPGYVGANCCNPIFDAFKIGVRIFFSIFLNQTWVISKYWWNQILMLLEVKKARSLSSAVSAIWGCSTRISLGIWDFFKTARQTFLFLNGLNLNSK